MADDNLVNLSATEAAAAIARGAFSAQDYTRAWLDRIAAIEPEIHAFAHLDPDHAMAQARERDEYRLSGAPLGPLHGIPVTIKDIIDTRDYPTEFGSALFAGRQPQEDATVVTKLRLAGAVILGKTVSTEFAYFHPGKTRNPHDVAHTPGGSSSGSAASVAAGMAPLAIGTQTNGSVIRPASFCGVYGMKPSKGLVSRAGVLPVSATVDTVGPFARSLPDLALLLQTMAGFDAADSDTRQAVGPNFPAFASEDFPIPPRFAFMRTPVWDKAEAGTRKAFDDLADKLGDACIRIDLPEHYADAWKVHRTIMAAEMAHNLGPFADRGGELVSRVLRDLVAEGRAIGAVQYLDALEEAREIASSFAGYFQHCNAIITPAARGGAPKGLDATGDPVFCTLWSLSGLPSVSLPLLQNDSGMPIGVQLVGGPQDDARLLRNANWLVKAMTPKGKRKARS